MNATPAWALAFAYWAHMVATVVWIGGLAALTILVIPAARRSLEPAAYASLLSSIQKRLEPLAWLSLVILVATGLFQMAASPNYNGFLAIDNTWSAAILAKHLVIFAMVAISAALTWWLLPEMRRLALQQARGREKHGREIRAVEPLQQREVWLLRANLALGLLVLALTALARVS